MAKVYRVSMVSMKGTIEVVNTFHYVVRTGGGGSSDAQDLLTQFLGHVQTKYLATVGTDSTLTKATCTQELAASDTTPPDHAEVGLNLTGTRTGIDTFNSTGLCALARFPSNAAVKGAHGRAFLHPASSSSALGANGTWNNSNQYWTNCVALVNELKNGFQSGSWWTLPWDANMVVYSRTRRNRGEAFYYFDVINASVDPIQHFLRSRLK